MICAGLVAMSATIIFYFLMDWILFNLSFKNEKAYKAGVELSMAAAAFFGVAVFLMIKEYM